MSPARTKPIRLSAIAPTIRDSDVLRQQVLQPDEGALADAAPVHAVAVPRGDDAAVVARDRAGLVRRAEERDHARLRDPRGRSPPNGPRRNCRPAEPGR